MYESPPFLMIDNIWVSVPDFLASHCGASKRLQVRADTIEYMLLLAEQLVSPAGRGVLPRGDLHTSAFCGINIGIDPAVLPCSM